MKHLGNYNLFASHFYVGTKEIKTTAKIEEAEALHQWIDFKDNDSLMTKNRTESKEIIFEGFETLNYRSSGTIYISFPKIIELDIFAKVLKDLMIMYHENNPFGSKSDFIEHALTESINYMTKFIQRENFIPLESFSNNYRFYYDRVEILGDTVDFGIDSQKTIEHYITYFNTILKYIEEIDYDLVVEKNPFPEIFSRGKAYYNFKEYSKRILNLHQEYSFLFNRMKKEEFLNQNITKKQYVEWLIDEKFITKKQFEKEFDSKDDLILTPSKCLKADKPNQDFNIIFNV